MEPRLRLPVPAAAAAPALGSAAFAAELAEVHAVSRSLTDEQRAIALFWADGPRTVTPPGHWNAIALDRVEKVGFGTRRTAQLFAALNTAQADAFIACWDTKFTYWSVRPVSAIRESVDPSWTSFIATPPFPSYVSGHSSTSGAASTVLARYFPRRPADYRSFPQKRRSRGCTAGSTFAATTRRASSWVGASRPRCCRHTAWKRIEGRSPGPQSSVTSDELVGTIPAGYTGGARRESPTLARRFPVGPGDTPLPAGTSAARATGNLQVRTTSFPR